MAVIQVENTGKVEIRPEDYARPLQIHVSEGTSILASEIFLHDRHMRVNDLIEAAVADRKSLTAPPMLLNEQEILEFRLLIDGIGSPLIVTARIAGGVIERKKPLKRQRWPERLSGYTGLTVLLGCLALAATLVARQW